jgi:Abortive infection alpha
MSLTNDHLEPIAEGLLPMLYRDALQPGVKQLGIALENVIGLVPALTLPAKYVSEKAQALMASHLEAYRKKLMAKPSEEIIPARAEIAAPIFQKLAYTQDTNLADIFIELLAKASLEDEQQLVHPSFCSVLIDLSLDEILIIKYLASKVMRPTPELDFCAVEIHLRHKVKGTYEKIRGPYTDWDLHADLYFEENLPAYVQNLVRLGLLNLTFNEELAPASTYAVITSRFMGLSVSGLEKAHKEIIYEKGVARITDYGELFMRACLPKNFKGNE